MRAILAGSGGLPRLVLEAGPAEVVHFAGVPAEVDATIEARFEQFGALFDTLRARGVTELCLAGAMSRPELNQNNFDEVTAALMPQLAPAMMRGDDALLRAVVKVFEAEGFVVLGAHELRPDLTASAGPIVGDASDRNLTDAARARSVLAALGPLDVGQAAVAGHGQVLGIETLQGTDAMLDFVRQSQPGSGGVLVKRPKPGQDLRVDMPAIGPETLARVAAADLTGVEIAAGGVLMLDRVGTMAAAKARGLTLWAAP